MQSYAPGQWPRHRPAPPRARPPRLLAGLPPLLLAAGGWLLALLLLPGPARAQDTLRYDNWRLEQADEFSRPGDSTKLAARWAFAYPWGRTLSGEAEYYTGREVNVRGGALLLTAHELASPRSYPPGTPRGPLRYSSGMLYGRHPATDPLRPPPCPPGTGLSYGLFEIRCRQPRARDSWPAFWLFGSPDEVDVFEGDGQGFSNNVHLNTNDYWRPGPIEEVGCQNFFYWPGARPLSAAYHRYTLEWLPDRLVYYFDGVPIRRETRFRPLGCAMTVIINLAMVAWQSSPADTLAIDYIRIYRPRRLPAYPFGAPAAQPLRNGVFHQPHLDAPERSNPFGPRGWELTQLPAGPLRLALRDNLNPPCGCTLPLPTGPDWQAPWLAGLNTSPISVRWAGPQPLRWTLLDAQGHPLRQGQADPGTWQPPLTGLVPGTYQMRLQAGAAECRQPVFVLDRPANSQPTARWLRPAPTAP